MKRSPGTTLLVLLMLIVGGLSRVHAQALDISSGGLPTITGSGNGTLTGSSSVLNDLVVSINFGEISPLNTNPFVKVTVPIAIRSNQDYKVTASITGGTNANAQALQR